MSNENEVFRMAAQRIQVQLFSANGSRTAEITPQPLPVRHIITAKVDPTPLPAITPHLPAITPHLPTPAPEPTPDPEVPTDLPSLTFSTR